MKGRMDVDAVFRLLLSKSMIPAEVQVKTCFRVRSMQFG